MCLVPPRNFPAPMGLGQVGMNQALVSQSEPAPIFDAGDPGNIPEPPVPGPPLPPPFPFPPEPFPPFPGPPFCVARGTQIVGLGDAPQVEEAQCSEWIRIETKAGHTLLATPNHPVISLERGKLPISELRVGELIVTDKGESEVVSVDAVILEDTKLRVSMPRGHLFWANGILSHNLKPIPGPGPQPFFNLPF